MEGSYYPGPNQKAPVVGCFDPELNCIPERYRAAVDALIKKKVAEALAAQKEELASKKRKGESSMPSEKLFRGTPEEIKKIMDEVLKEEEWRRIGLPSLKTRPPFTREIMETRIPWDFEAPQIPLYEGDSDPLAHVHAHFSSLLGRVSDDDNMRCLLFPGTLGEIALRWFYKLPPGSVSSYTDLTEKFIQRFVWLLRIQREDESPIFSFEQGERESLWDWYKRFMRAAAESDYLTPREVIGAFRRGTLDREVVREIYRVKPQTMEELADLI